MNSNKLWYEKAGIWIGIIAGICTILAFIFSFNNTSNKNLNEAEANKIDDSVTMEEDESIAESFQILETDETENQDITVEDTKLSEEELFIEQNFELIQKLKEDYKYEDIKIIENDNIEFYIYEGAGYIFKNLKRTGECDILEGDRVSFTKAIILDYFTDEIIYIFNPEESSRIIYSPGDQNVFYCVVFHNNYDIYVSCPIQAVGGEYQNTINICLEKKNSTYTPLFQIHLYVQDTKSEESYSRVSTGYRVHYYCENKYSGDASVIHQIMTSDSGILSSGEKSYFSLNTNYKMNISLFGAFFDPSLYTRQMIDGSVTDSNLIDIYFNLED